MLHTRLGIRYPCVNPRVFRVPRANDPGLPRTVYVKDPISSATLIRCSQLSEEQGEGVYADPPSRPGLRDSG